MDFDDWIKAGNGAQRGESLEDAVGRTVGNMYATASESCRSCGSMDVNGNWVAALNGRRWSCYACGHSWTTVGR